MARKAKSSVEKSEQKPTFSSLKEKFLNHRQLIGLSPRTLTFYKDILNYLNAHGFPQDIELCTREEVELYITKLLKQGMKPVTVNGKIHILKALFNFASKETILILIHLRK